MTIAKETTIFARRLVTTETHMRRALKHLCVLAGDKDGSAKKARNELDLALVGAVCLPEDMMNWTASDQVQAHDNSDHIDMMCNLTPLARGAAGLTKLRDMDLDCYSAIAAAVNELTDAMEAICGAHVTLLALCKEWCIEVPKFSTTRDGGR